MCIHMYMCVYIYIYTQNYSLVLSILEALPLMCVRFCVFQTFDQVLLCILCLRTFPVLHTSTYSSQPFVIFAELLPVYQHLFMPSFCAHRWAVVLFKRMSM